MTGHEGTSEFCFPETLQHWGPGPIIKGFFHTSQLKTRKRKLRKNRLPCAYWLTNVPGSQGARPDHVRVESWRCYLPGESVSFDPRRVTRSPPIGKRIWVGRYNNLVSKPCSWISLHNTAGIDCIVFLPRKTVTWLSRGLRQNIRFIHRSPVHCSQGQINNIKKHMIAKLTLLIWLAIKLQLFVIEF